VRKFGQFEKEIKVPYVVKVLRTVKKDRSILRTIKWRKVLVHVSQLASDQTSKTRYWTKDRRDEKTRNVKQVATGWPYGKRWNLQEAELDWTLWRELALAETTDLTSDRLGRSGGGSGGDDDDDEHCFTFYRLSALFAKRKSFLHWCF